MLSQQKTRNLFAKIGIMLVFMVLVLFLLFPVKQSVFFMCSLFLTTAIAIIVLIWLQDIIVTQPYYWYDYENGNMYYMFWLRDLTDDIKKICFYVLLGLIPLSAITYNYMLLSNYLVIVFGIEIAVMASAIYIYMLMYILFKLNNEEYKKQSETAICL
jgi:hypothetical protein